MSARVVSQHQVAEHCGVSVATVSLALRHSPKIPAVTIARVEAAARQLGYRANPLVSRCMSYLRQGNQCTALERVALVWLHPPGEAKEHAWFFSQVLLGVQQRAGQLRIALEEFWLHAPGMTARRLRHVLRARGIHGVVLAPAIGRQSQVCLEWDWTDLAAVIIGTTPCTPEPHRVAYHHYEGMRATLRELARRGFRRVAAIVDHDTNERAQRGISGAFLACHPDPARARGLLHLAGPHDGSMLAGWIRRRRPDALIVSRTDLLSAPGVGAVAQALSLEVATLYWSPSQPQVAGIDQRYGAVAAAALDVVAMQLTASDVGVPVVPKVLYFPGRWVTPQRP